MNSINQHHHSYMHNYSISRLLLTDLELIAIFIFFTYSIAKLFIKNNNSNNYNNQKMFEYEKKYSIIEYCKTN